MPARGAPARRARRVGHAHGYRRGHARERGEHGMNLFLESVRSALASIRAHRLRSFLTSLGIVIGVASVITVISLIQGLSKSVSDQFMGLGGNGLTIKPHFEFKDAMRGKINYLRFD